MPRGDNQVEGLVKNAQTFCGANGSRGQRNEGTQSSPLKIRTLVLNFLTLVGMRQHDIQKNILSFKKRNIMHCKTIEDITDFHELNIAIQVHT